MEKIKKTLRIILVLKYMIELQKGNKISDFFKKDVLLLFFKGFTTEKTEIYSLEKNSYKNYLSDWQRRNTAWINGKSQIILDNKVIFEKIFSKKEICPKTFGEIKNGRIIWNNRVISMEKFLNYLEQKKKLILKPIQGGGGKGIKILEYKNGRIYLNNKEQKKIEIETHIKKINEEIISEFIENGSYIKEIYSETTNTIRVLTMIEEETNQPFIAVAVQRVGSSTTYPVDNVWNGGYSSKIDLKTGILGKVAYHTNYNKTIEWNKNHKDTYKKIEGIRIKNWDKIKQEILELATEINFIKYIGWDVVATDNGVRIIEANNYSDVNFLQIHGPLLLSEKVKKFYQHHNIVYK